jgi:hypothetical protein
MEFEGASEIKEENLVSVSDLFNYPLMLQKVNIKNEPNDFHGKILGQVDDGR